jgi:hypothetical protein
LLVNIIGLVWAVRSWKKGLQEKWMNNVRDAGAEIIGASEFVHGTATDRSSEQSASARADFITKEQKLLLLFAHNSAEKNNFQQLAENLRHAADTHSKSYRSELDTFSSAVSERVMQEWQKVKAWV